MNYRVESHGSIVLLTPLTHEVTEHLAEHMPDDAHRMGRSYVIEPRYVQPIIDDLEENFA